MTVRDRAIALLKPLYLLTVDPISLLGAVLTTSSAFTMIGFWLLELVSGGPTHPYAGIVLFMILPGVFIAGLALMPVGALRRRWRARKGVAETPPLPDKDTLRNAVMLVGGLSIVNVVLLGVASYKGVEYMDSTTFCGLACHKVMVPEYTAYLDSPHSRVECVKCHIGPGASWFVKAKLSGARQVLAVTLGTYSRPIPSPVHHLRPARETCEQCHWPDKFHGGKLYVSTKFAEDETNSPASTVLLMRIGGRQVAGRVGIHGRHLDENSRIRFQVKDDKRQVIPRVRYIDDDGKEVEYVSGETAPTTEGGEWRDMDCIDCHNRPTHAFDLPERAVDRAMAAGRISSELPWIKREAVAALKATYPDRETAEAQIVARIVSFYEQKHPEIHKGRWAQVEAAAHGVRDIYLRNVFPTMKLTWGSHPNNIGHDDFPGCFRCHDDEHKSKDGKVISQDCDACHQVLAMEEKDPKVLVDLGLK